MSYRDELKQKLLEAMEIKDRQHAESHLKKLCDEAAARGKSEVEIHYNVDLSLHGILERKDTEIFAKKFGLDTREDTSKLFATDWISWSGVESSKSLYRNQLIEKATLASQGRTDELHDFEVEIYIKSICDEAANIGDAGAKIEYVYKLNDGTSLGREDIEKFAQKFNLTFWKGEEGQRYDMLVFVEKNEELMW